MKPSRRSLQLVVLGPVLALMIASGGVLYFLVLRSAGNFADASIRANLDALARSAFLIADAEVDRQNREWRTAVAVPALAGLLFARWALVAP